MNHLSSRSNGWYCSRFYVIGLLACVLSLCLSGIPTAIAQATFHWDFINVDIDVKRNGDMLVTETQKYVFTGKPTSERVRSISLDKIDKVDQISITESDKQIPFRASTTNANQLIQWENPKTNAKSHTFTLKYRVIGGLQVFTDRTEVNWQALFPNRSAPIASSRVIVRLPEAIKGNVREYSAYGAAAKTTFFDDQTIAFTLKQPLSPEQMLGVKVSVPSNILTIPRPKWEQQQQPQSRNWQKAIPIILVGLLTPFGLIGLAMFLGKSKVGPRESGNEIMNHNIPGGL